MRLLEASRIKQRAHTNDSNYVRKTGPMLESQRRGAMTRRGKACMSLAVSGKKRCRINGGAAGSVAPQGNKSTDDLRGKLTRNVSWCVAAAGLPRTDQQGPIDAASVAPSLNLRPFCGVLFAI
jgi:hypothetical protein